MRKFKIYLSFITIFLSCFLSVHAQDKTINKDSLLNNITNVDIQLKKYLLKDTTIGFSAPIKIDTAITERMLEDYQPERDENGLLILKRDWIPFGEYVLFRDTVIFDPGLLPVVFDGRLLPSDMDFLDEKAETNVHLISPDSTFAPQLARMERINESRRNYYLTNPLKIKLNALAFEDIPVIHDNVVERNSPLRELLSADDPIEITTPEVDKIEIKPVFWIVNGEHSLQGNQNSFSNNWSGGGDDNFSIINYHKMTFNYKKDKITFDNLVEWRLNLQRVSGDTIRQMNITDDFFRTYSKFGIAAFKKWSYTSNLEIKTPLFQGYPINSNEMSRAFLSPLTINWGIGLGYKLEKISSKDKHKRLDLTLDLAPGSLNYTLVSNSKVDPTKFGVDEGKKSNLDFGSTINATFFYGFNRYSKFTSRLKYFTNYEKALLESENKYTIALNRYLSASAYLYLRYDDSVGPENKGKHGYLQYNQNLGFGLSYTW